MAGKSYIKVGSNDWDRIKKMYIKAAGQTWIAVRKSYIKTSSGWQKVFDTASNRPFISGNDFPKIRLNTFRTNSSVAGTVNPVVEAPPVQQMGPSWTSPTLGWPYESLGGHLYGYDGTWVSGNGSAMTFAYRWFYNLTGNANNDTEELNATSSTGRADMITNSSTHLGQSDGDYFDKNFLTFKVTATNSAGNATAPSTPVYIVREVPTGSITMVSTGTAFTNYSMDAVFTYSNNWYNKTNVSNSYIEWFAVNNLGDTLTNNNRVEIQNLSSIAVTGTTSKSGTTSHVPTLANKYYYVKITLNNSGTQNAVIAINGFIPKSPTTAQANKTALTSAPLTAPTISSITYNGSSVLINFSGGSGPYYELYHSNSPNAADGLLTNYYDAASTFSPLTESIVIAVGTTRYFWLRSSSVNRGNTTASGNAADGTFGPWASSGFSFTAPILHPQPFNTISYVKNFPSSSAQGVVRSTSLSWNASTNATRYEIEYEGSNDNSSWTTVQSFAASPYTSSTSQNVSWGSPVPAGGFAYYTYMRARVRASNPDSATQVIGDSGSYIYASGVAPGQPSFGTITYNLAGTTASIPVTVGAEGSNYLYSPPIQYQYRQSPFGSYSGTWVSSSTPISLTGLNANTTYYIKIRTRNYDELVSPENEISFSTPAASVAPTGGSASISGATAVGSTLTLTKTDATGSPNPTATWLWRINDGGFGGGTFSGGSIVQNGGSTYTSQYAGYSVRVEITWSNTIAPAQSVITNSIAVVAAVVAPTIISGSEPVNTKTNNTRSFSVTNGSWNNSPTGYSYQWRAQIYLVYPPYVSTVNVGTNSSSYSGSSTYDGYGIFCNVTASNTGGSNTASSNQITQSAPVQYTVTWNANGGSPNSSTGPFAPATAHTAPGAPLRDGFTFSNWRNPQSGGDPTFVAADGSYTPTGNITFYAQWTSSAVAPTTPTGVGLTTSGAVSWSAVSGATSYEVQTYTDQTSSPENTNNRLGPYTATGITGTSYQLSATDNYAYPNNYARIQVRARNSAGASTYSAWVPSNSTYK